MKKVILNSLTVLILSINSCNQHHQASKSHEERLEFNEKFPDTLFFKVPDSLKAVVRILRLVQQNDQKFRDIADNSYYVKNLASQNILDSINRHTVDSLINIYGILGYKQIGLIAQKGQVFTLIHSSAAFKEKYLLQMQQAQKDRKIFAEYYATFVDKYLAQKKYLQLYGTQFITHNGELVPYPFNVTTINANRKKIGMTNFFTTKSTLLKTAKIDSIGCAVLFPEIIKELKIDTAKNENFKDL
jgi:hypothetical protein